MPRERCLTRFVSEEAAFGFFHLIGAGLGQKPHTAIDRFGMKVRVAFFDEPFQLSGAEALGMVAQKCDGGVPVPVGDRFDHEGRIHADCAGAHNNLSPRQIFWRGAYAP